MQTFPSPGDQGCLIDQVMVVRTKTVQKVNFQSFRARVDWAIFRRLRGVLRSRFGFTAYMGKGVIITIPITP